MNTNSMDEYTLKNRLSDEKLIQLINKGDDEALEILINKYKGFVRSKARTYFLIGGDRDDIIQEGMIGLYKAIRDYDMNKAPLFKNFVDICVTRQIITAVKSATRQKHIPLNSYISLSAPIYDEDSETTLIDLLPIDEFSDPEKMIINEENYKGMRIAISEILSKFEQKVLSLYLNGKTYQEIAEELSKKPKSIDNALQRLKTKIGNSV